MAPLFDTDGVPTAIGGCLLSDETVACCLTLKSCDSVGVPVLPGADGGTGAGAAVAGAGAGAVAGAGVVEPGFAGVVLSSAARERDDIDARTSMATDTIDERFMSSPSP